MALLLLHVLVFVQYYYFNYVQTCTDLNPIKHVENYKQKKENVIFQSNEVMEKITNFSPVSFSPY
jgi:hypothetical protein